MGFFIIIGFVILLECLALFITSHINVKRKAKDPYLLQLQKMNSMLAEIVSYFSERQEYGDPAVHELSGIHEELVKIYDKMQK